MKNHLILAVLLLWTSIVFAGSMSGTYTVNPMLPNSGTNYSSLDTAMLDLQKKGIGGDITFSLADGTYSTPIILDSLYGGLYFVTFVSTSGDSSKVMLSASLSFCYNFRFQKLSASISLNGGCGNIYISGCLLGLTLSPAPDSFSTNENVFIYIRGCTEVGLNASGVVSSGYYSSGSPWHSIDGAPLYSYGNTYKSISLSQVGQANFSHDSIRSFYCYECETEITNSNINSIQGQGDTVGAFIQMYYSKVRDRVGLSWAGGYFVTNFLMSGLSLDGEAAGSLSMYSNSIYYDSKDTFTGAVEIDATSNWPSAWQYEYQNYYFEGNIFANFGKGIGFRFIDYWMSGGSYADWIVSSNNDYYSAVKNHEVTDWDGYPHDVNYYSYNTFAWPHSDVEFDPGYKSTTDLHPSSDSIKGRGLSGSALDIDGHIRPSAPTIGAAEMLDSHDAAIMNLGSTGPQSCTGNNGIKLLLLNHGKDSIVSAKINWSLNGVAKSPVYWKGNLLSFDTTTIVLSTFSFAKGKKYTIKAWLDSSNGKKEVFRKDDTCLASWTATGKHSNPVINVGTNITLCMFSSIKLSTKANGSNTYQWFANGGYFSGNPVYDTVRLNWGNNAGTVTLAENDNGCVDSAKLSVKLLTKMIISGPSRICLGSIPQYAVYTAPTGVGHKWKVIGGVGLASSSNDTFNVRWDSSGTGYIIRKDSIPSSCSFIDTLKINIIKSAASARISYTGACIADSVHFTGTAGANNSLLWNFGDKNSSTITKPAHLYASIGMYSVSLIARDSMGCTDTALLALKIDSSCLNRVYGIISTSSGAPLKYSPAYVVRFDSTDTTLNILGKSTTDSNGWYNFIVRDSMVYLVAYPDSAIYPKEMVTWRDTALVFQDASPVKLKTPASAQVNFHTLKGINNSGTGFIGGNVTICLLCKNAKGTPATGLRLVLVDNNKHGMASVYSDANGRFVFPNLPAGVYYVWVDKPGIDNSKAPQVTLSSTNMVRDSLNFVLYPTYLDLVITTGVESADNTQAGKVTISPNPFKGYTNISYELTGNSWVTLEIFDLLGQKVTTSVNEEEHAGAYTVRFNPEDYGTSRAGMYLIKMHINGQQSVYKAIMLH